MKPTNIRRLLDWMQLPHQDVSDSLIKGVCVDSRRAREGDLFFALSGAKCDGHAFLSSAAAKGVAVALVHPSYAGPDFGMALIRTEDGLAALQLLAKNYLQTSSAPIIGLTGSLGKTTTKGFIATLLQKRYRVASTHENYNSQIGLPLTILNQVMLDEELIVLEMGMTHPGQIEKLVQIAAPSVALVTFIAPVHIANFESLEQLARAKAEIFSHPGTKTAIYHLESDLNGVLSKGLQCEKLSFSTVSHNADYYMEPDSSIRERAGKPIPLPQLPLPGAHNRHNLLAAIAVARQFDLSWEEIAAAVPELFLPERRLQRVDLKGITFINDSYNASEASMKAALASLPEPIKGGKRCAVLGGMVDLGVYSEQTHRNVGEHALGCVDLLFCFGEECQVMEESWRRAHKPVVWAKEKKELLPALHEHLSAGDVVLLKGSCSKAVWELLDEL